MTPTTKRIRITLEDGRIYSIAAHAVAHDRATYYANGDMAQYAKEYEHAVTDDDELMDWLIGDMNWWEHDPRLERTSVLKPLRECYVASREVVPGP